MRPIDQALLRVRKLIKLAVNPSASENEARNAALQAVKLIDQYKMLDECFEPPSSQHPGRSPSTAGWPFVSEPEAAGPSEKAPESDFFSIMDSIFRGFSGSTRGAQSVGSDRVRYQTFQRNTCVRCKQPIVPGDVIVIGKPFVAEPDPMHERCFKEASCSRCGDFIPNFQKGARQVCSTCIYDEKLGTKVNEEKRAKYKARGKRGKS